MQKTDSPPQPQPGLAAASGESTHRYDGMAIALHWVLGVLIIMQFLIGLTLDAASPEEWRARVNFHSGTGMLIFFLVILRLLWIGRQGWIPYPPNVPRFYQSLAWAGFVGLYVLILIVPIIGFITASGKAGPVEPYGLFRLPKLYGEALNVTPQAGTPNIVTQGTTPPGTIAPSTVPGTAAPATPTPEAAPVPATPSTAVDARRRDVSEWVEDIHSLGAWVLILLASFHVVSVLFTHYVHDRRFLRRMLPW